MSASATSAPARRAPPTASARHARPTAPARPPGNPDRGSGTITAVGLLALCLLLATLLVPTMQLAPARHRAAAAADAAAIAAADTLIGLHAGDPCERAGQVARAHGAELRACVPDGLIVTVEAVVVTAFVPLFMSATAGPPS